MKILEKDKKKKIRGRVHKHIAFSLLHDSPNDDSTDL